MSRSSMSRNVAALGTRIHKIGSIYSRVKNLLDSGVMDARQKPMWYDIYKAFPPKREPVFIAGPSPDEHGLITIKDTVQPILYREDWARVAVDKLYKDFESVHDLSVQESDQSNISRSFIKTFVELLKLHPNLSQDEIFQKVEQSYRLT